MEAELQTPFVMVWAGPLIRCRIGKTRASMDAKMWLWNGFFR